MKRSKRSPEGLSELLTEFCLEDIVAASDADILDEIEELGGDPNTPSELVRRAFDAAERASAKQRLLAARKAIEAENKQPLHRVARGEGNDRAKLARILEANRSARLTLAARKEEDLSDADVAGLLEDLKELGFNDIENDGGGP